MGKTVPDRWLDYKSHGRVIKNTRIIAFKVPLKFETCRRLLPTDQFTPEMLMKSLPNLKYIIDLTATTRYYKRTDFTSSGISHVKVEVPGQAVPRRNHSLKFFDAMDTFMGAAKDDELIGVHCTHGLNRTGFMVCQYLIRQLGWDVADAIKEFENARGHTMERLPYLEELRTIPKGDKLNTRINKELINSKIDEREKVDEKSMKGRSSGKRKLQEAPTNWRDHFPLLPPPPRMPINSYSGRSYSREYSNSPREFPHKNQRIDNSKELIKPTFTRTTQQNIHEQHSNMQEYPRRIDKRRAIISGDETSLNIAEKFRKLENTFPIICNKYSHNRRTNDFTTDSFDNNFNVAHTVPIPQKSKKKHHSKLD